MHFEKLAIPGSYRVLPELRADERGAFARTFCAEEFAARGLVDRFVQHSLSVNRHRGTVRGLHFQASPHGETKLVRCVRGAAFDVIVDLRPDSIGFGGWCGTEISAAKSEAVYIPKGCAHGFQTLTDDCQLEYLIVPVHVPSASRGIRWTDPALAIDWPINSGVVISDRDRELPFLADITAEL
jgi:dTDP-4-dehydrorhamnose 3,5-epimerase